MIDKSSLSKIILITLFSFFAITSCKTTRNISNYEVKPIPVSKIIKKVEKESPSYKSYESKKVVIDFETNNTKNSISGQFSILRNNNIILSARKLTFPLGKVLLTPDSLKLINYLEKKFIADDIASLQKLLGVDIDFELVQSLLTADVGKLLDNNYFDKQQTVMIDSQMYRINSKLDNRIDLLNNSAQDKKLEAYLNKMKEKKFTNYSLWVDPQLFIVRKILLYNILENESLTLCFDQFELVGRSLFPQQISLKHFSPTQNLKVNLKLSKSTVNNTKDFNFVIPDKFEKSKISRN